MLGFDYLIIGNGPAGVGGVEGVRKVDPKGTIAIVGDERAMPYSRCLLPGYISGRVSEKSLTYRPSSFYERNGVSLFLGRRATSLDPSERKVQLDDGSRLGYGRLLLATGSSALLRSLKGNHLPGVHLLRTIEDAQSISEEAARARSAVVMGGGLVGIGVAIALHQRGILTHLVSASPRVLSQNVDQRAADLVAGHLRKSGIDVVLSTDVDEILGTDRAIGARLSDGRILECDLVVSAKGVEMNTDLAVGAGLSVRRGVVVDDHLRTSSPDIYAAGDVAEAKDFITGQGTTLTIWPVASEQGRVAGMNMAGGDSAYPGGVQICAVDFLGMPVVTVGESREPKDASASEGKVEMDTGQNGYRKLAIRDGRVVGAILVGGAGDIGAFKGVPCTRIDVRAIRDLLLKDGFEFDRLVGALLVREPAAEAR
ncbi:MAG: FAD-dependent oxidoreductase [Methanomassiliicoccales archaeon]|nr:FAD-dependent oxidoreductase [Methanomassiliicoccales archaeon]